MLDGDYDLNETMEAVFDDNGARCGFAPTYAGIGRVNHVETYLKWQEKGHEILTHGTYLISEKTEFTDEQCVTFIRESYEKMTGLGLNVKGYISSCGAAADRFIPEIRKYYQYAGTRSNHSSEMEPCLYRGKDTRFTLWRYSMQVSTPAQMRNAVDQAKENNTLCIFYGHAKSMNKDNFTGENLDALLKYIRKQKVEIKIPYKAVIQTFDRL